MNISTVKRKCTMWRNDSLSIQLKDMFIQYYISNDLCRMFISPVTKLCVIRDDGVEGFWLISLSCRLHHQINYEREKLIPKSTYRCSAYFLLCMMHEQLSVCNRYYIIIYLYFFTSFVYHCACSTTNIVRMFSIF